VFLFQYIISVLQVIVSDVWELVRCYQFSASWYRSFVCVSIRINTIFKFNFIYSVWKSMWDITLFLSTYTVSFFFNKAVSSVKFWTFQFLGFQSGTAYSSILGYFTLPVGFFFKSHSDRAQYVRKTEFSNFEQLKKDFLYIFAERDPAYLARTVRRVG
jgi:hypothetical protein